MIARSNKLSRGATRMIGAVAGLSALALASGCAAPLQPRSGFLSDYKRLQPSGFENVLLYRAPGFDPAAYSRVDLVPTAFHGDSKELRQLAPEFKKEILEHIDAELAARVRSSHKGSSAGGAGESLRLRAAITEIETPNRVLNAATALFAGSLTRGGAALELELSDVRGNVLVAATCSERGHPIADQFSSFSMLGHARIAISECIRRFEIAYSAPRAQ